MIRFVLISILVFEGFAYNWTPLNDLIGQAINEKTFPGASVIVLNENGTIFKKNYGFFTYNYELGTIPVTDNTKYDVASITKVMATTLAMMNLISSNSIKMNDTVLKYIKNYDTNKKGNTTIANLMLHNAGLPYDYPGTLPKTSQQVLEYVTFAKPVSPIGTKFQYSNLGFLLLGKIIQKAANKDFKLYFDQNKIFAGFKNSQFSPAVSQMYRIPPTEYDKEVRKMIIRGQAHQRVAFLFKGIAGHSGLFSTAEDVARYIRILLCKGKIGTQTRVLPESIVTQFTTKIQGLPYPSTRAYGFDTQCPSTKMANCFGHDGSTGIMAWADKDRKVAFVVMSNRGHPDAKNANFSLYRQRIASTVMTALGY